MTHPTQTLEIVQLVAAAPGDWHDVVYLDGWPCLATLANRMPAKHSGPKRRPVARVVN